MGMSSCSSANSLTANSPQCSGSDTSSTKSVSSDSDHSTTSLGSATSQQDLALQLIEAVNPESVMGNTQVALPKSAAVPLLGRPPLGESFSHIHANRVQACSATVNDSSSPHLRCLGQTPSKSNPSTPGSQLNAGDLQYVTTLLDQAHQLRAKPNLGGQYQPARMTQFISPLAFNNPEKSKDRALSSLLQAFTQSGSQWEGYQILSVDLLDEPVSTMHSKCGLTRRFEVKYSKQSDHGGHTLILTEHAPDYRNGNMSTEAIEKALEAMGGAQSEGPEVMLSYLGVGRVAIMQTVLDVLARMKLYAEGNIGTRPSLDEMLDEAIAHVEQARGPYISKRREQREAILEVLKKSAPPEVLVVGAQPQGQTQIQTQVEGQPEPPIVDQRVDALQQGSRPQGNQNLGAALATNQPQDKAPSYQKVKPEPSSDPTIAKVDGAQIGDSKNSTTLDKSSAEVEKDTQQLHVSLANVGLSSGINKCYANSAFKFMHCWLGEHLTVHKDYLNDKDGNKVEPYVRLSNELEKIKGRLTDTAAENQVASLRKFIEALVADDLMPLSSRNAVSESAFENPNQSEFHLGQFKSMDHQDASEFVTTVTTALGLSDIQTQLNAPFFKTKMTLTHAQNAANFEKQQREVAVAKADIVEKSTAASQAAEQTALERGAYREEAAAAKAATLAEAAKVASNPKNDPKPKSPTEFKTWDSALASQVEFEVPSEEKETQVFQIKSDSVTPGAKPKNMKEWIVSSLNPRPEEGIHFKLGEALSHVLEGGRRRFDNQTLDRIAEGEKKLKVKVSQTLVSKHSTLHIADASAASKLALNLVPYHVDSTHSAAFDLAPIDLNEEIVLDLIDGKDDTQKKVSYQPTAFVFHDGGIQGGHYFMLAKVQRDDRLIWMRHDDSVVTPLREDDVKAFTSNAAKTGARPTLVLLQSTNSLAKDGHQPPASPVSTAPGRNSDHTRKGAETGNTPLKGQSSKPVREANSKTQTNGTDSANINTKKPWHRDIVKKIFTRKP